ncbi:MAG: YggT family protein [Spirochaetaceae bacterium]
MVSNIFGFISLVLSAYSFIIFIRIILSWFNLRNNFNGASQNRVILFIYSITDPYLDWFKRFSFLRLGVMDFSAMLAIAVLYFFSNITGQIAMSGVLSLGFIIKLILSTIWSLVSSISIFVMILLAVRLVFMMLNKYSGFFHALDNYTETYARKFSNIFTKKFTSYKTNLIIMIFGIFIIRLLINYLLVFLFSMF